MAKTIIFDLETIPADDMPAWEEPDRFPTAPFHHIVCMSAVILGDGDPEVRSVREEEPCIRQVAEWMTEGARLVSWNGRGFDVPVIATRALKYGIAIPLTGGRRDYVYRFKEDAHLDLQDQVTLYGAARPPKLDHVAKMLGLLGKTDTDGSMVHELWPVDPDRVVRYCECDALNTAGVYVAYMLSRRGANAERGEALRAWIMQELAARQVEDDTAGE